MIQHYHVKECFCFGNLSISRASSTDKWLMHFRENQLVLGRIIAVSVTIVP